MVSEQRSPSARVTDGLPVAQLVSLSLGVVLVLALAAWAWAQRPPAEGSADVLFSRDMVAHHQQAVQMATTLRERTDDPRLRTILLDMTLTQQGQIGQMQGWLGVWGRPLSTERPPMNGQGTMMGMATPEQLASLSSLPVDQAEVAFLQMMIRHHQGALMMADDALANARQPVVMRLAQAIKDGQSSEIRLMESMLTERGAPLPEPLPPMDHGSMY